ncbi:MAG: 1-deoxy-D-xylulose-5-phosphate reductoisomerase [Firmicutes bacterium]|nr:1-deoxy-D-xylulose-5-phosphate reductoisomerase [Bacillota bacterium]
MINLTILGSTGSIGRQALEVADWHPERLRVRALAAHDNWRLLAEQAKKYRPALVAVADEAVWEPLRRELSGLPIRVLAGEEGLLAAAAADGADTALAAMSGLAGLRPLLAAIDSGKTVALANKEALVASGQLVTERCRERGVELRPVDSEHSAVWQCLAGEDPSCVEELIITCSGGAFRELSRQQLATVRAADALRHPNWQMGRKITVDCATLVNKGLEVIEAHWLFGVDYDKIKVAIHPQSLVHSLVCFRDGSVKAQLGPADMRLPIAYALLGRERLPNPGPRLDLLQAGRLDFLPPDESRFPGLRAMLDAGKRGGLLPAYLNGANEALVEAFLRDGIPYLFIGETLRLLLAQAPPEMEDAEAAADLDAVLAADARGRADAAALMEN